MAEAFPAAGTERLPWLSDPAPVKARQRRSWAPPILFLGVMGAIGLGGWFVLQQPISPEPAPIRTVERVALPAPHAPAPPAAAEPQPASPSERESLRPQAPPASEEPTVRLEERRTEARPAARRPSERGRTAPSSARARSRPAAAPAPAVARRQAAPVTVRQQPLALWPARQQSGAAGRLVQIGAFGTRQQAKLGWRRMQRSYPAVGRLPAVVVDARNSKGRKFYRFQIGTTSHAHSEVLCQRMQAIGYSCAVLGLPWKAKVER